MKDEPKRRKLADPLTKEEPAKDLKIKVQPEESALEADAQVGAEFGEQDLGEAAAEPQAEEPEVEEIEPPRILPIFPLTGALLLPGGRLPLFMFETRYVQMVEDALAADRCIGMIQPASPRPRDQYGEGDQERPELFRVGCAGLIEHWEQLPPDTPTGNDRYLILLTGLRRFRIRRELDLFRGYRRAEVDYDEFAGDPADAKTELGAEPLLAALDHFGRSNHLMLQLDRLGEISGMALLNSMAMALPFAPSEKQAILEAPNIFERQALLLALLEMGLELRSESRLSVH